jgi:hypothetical protein
MIMLESRCRSGHYLAAVMPMGGDAGQLGYQVLVFRQGSEVYEEKEESLADAVRTAKAFLRWRAVQDLVLADKCIIR